MVNGFDAASQERLKLAEEAELELNRIKPLAAEAPLLRAEKAKAQRNAERARTREASLQQAKKATDTAAERQSQVPDLLGAAARAVNQLYTALREIDSHRRESMQALAVADRVDYEIELELEQEQETSTDRDNRGLAYALAARHGDARVKKLLEELEPGFSLLNGCNLNEQLNRDVADFVMERVMAAGAVAARSK
jgi:phage-related tail protein